MIRAGAVLAAVLVAAPAAARVVDYAPDDAAMRAIATELKIAPVSPLPERGDRPVSVTVDAAADHETLALGMHCSAYKVLNPISRLMPPLVSAWAGGPPRQAGPAGIVLHVTSARSYRRCVEVGEANVRCITRAAIEGTVGADGRSAAISASAERDASVGGVCGGLARGIAVVSREAGIALIADARAKLAGFTTEPAPPPAR